MDDLFTTFQTIVMTSTVVVLVLMVYTHLRMEWLNHHHDTPKTWLPRFKR